MTKKTTIGMAREYLARLDYYISQSVTLPLHGGRVNATAVAAACRFDRQVLYKNKKCRALLEAAALKQGVAFIEAKDTAFDGSSATREMVPAAELREVQKRVTALEKRLYEMTARNAAISARLRQQLMIEDELIASGRRSRPPEKSPLFNQEVKD
mgnify:CR=1 FL=1